MQDKQTLRKTVMGRLEKEQSKSLSEKNRRIHNALFTLSAWQNARTVGITISRGTEVDTWAVLEEGWRLGKVMAAPKCDPETKSLTFYSITSFDDLEDSFYGLKEPNPLRCRPIEDQRLDLVIVPGVVYTEEGWRIGFGGGYYDRFLARHSDVPTCSLLYSAQLAESIPVEPHDQPVKQLITENGVI
ncbi:5-formyltetrahydrofolate cyclo-ligase [Alteribacter lacisalsi]|uniref:5-formyltetrahydrofolate cyclo-ligase n=1 Tax=Alteribacter lacisalsi TaxID=2045244 RepID=A0A2W0HCP2_9BACI|nr:5-formyltetrahydrofolate cyclo-ligase [Alteribacter lacisalsi]PYZ98631.1 5-formyltetrahydrofolate cyclo-ligase [Alteribacter lacisalsi]